MAVPEQPERDVCASPCLIAAECLHQVQQAHLPAGPPPPPGSLLRPDAAVNAANALTSWAEVTGEPQQRRQLLQQAVQLYRAALQQEEDALVRQKLNHIMHHIMHHIMIGIMHHIIHP